MENTKNDGGMTGLWIPLEIWCDGRLSPAEKILLAEIDNLNQSEGCFATDAYLAVRCGLSERSVRNALCRLEGLHLLSRSFIRRRGKKRRLLIPTANSAEADAAKFAERDGKNCRQKNKERKINLCCRDAQDDFDVAAEAEIQKAFDEVLARRPYPEEVLLLKRQLPGFYESLSEAVADEWLLLYQFLSEAVASGRPNLRYVLGVMRNWQKAGIRNYGHYVQKDLERRRLI